MELIELSRFKVSCESCSLAELCLPRGLCKDDLERLEAVVRRSRPLQKGEFLFRAGDVIGSLFAVRSGSVKLYTGMDNGDEQIIGFYLPGEILGLDAIEHNRHTCSAVSLETSSICSFPYSQLSEVCLAVLPLQEQMFRIMGREISAENELLLTLGKKSAEERISTFLISLSGRFKRLGYSAKEFRLSMSRQEIGNYLGLTIETVSRVFSRFQKGGLIKTSRRFVQILDLNGLRQMSTTAPPEGAPSRHSVA